MRYQAQRARFLLPLLTSLTVSTLLTPLAKAAPFTLEEVLSAPYPSGLVAASGADRIAWVMNDEGVRNLYTAAAPDFEPVRLTSYEEDDGQALSSLRLTADGSLLVYVRGSGPNSAGEIANPSHDPEGAEQATWGVSTAGGEPRKLVSGGGPVLSPAGDRLVYARGKQVFALALAVPSAPDTPADTPADAAAGAPEPEPLFEARGRQRALTFSPDGRRLAFVSARGDHSFVGIFDLARKKITWMAPSVDRDFAPAWSPEGTRLAFLRQPGARIGELYDLTKGVAFALWVADPASGEAREIWRSPGADGGYAQNSVARPLAWAGRDRLVFTSEHEGWLHVYAVAVSGGKARNLTPGPGEVESFALSSDGATLFFSGNREDTNRRHLWRVRTAGGPPERWTAGAGIETDPTLLASEDWLAFRKSDARLPQAVSVLSTTSKEHRRITPAPGSSFPAAALVEPEPVVFTASDGLTIHGQLFLPRGARAGDARPAVIFLHGGPVRQMLLGWHYSHYYARSYAFNQYLASRGTVVLSVNFRSGIGYGRPFRQAANQGPRGAAEYRDILAAGIYLRDRPEVDPGKIGLWGGSYGGYLTALGLARDSDLFAAGVDLHGVHDWAHRGTDFPLPGGAWGLRDQELDRARLSSPVADLSYWSSPVLFVHGDDDRNVLFIQTTDLVQRLRERDVAVETLIFPDEVHGFLRHTSWLRTFRAAADFFARFLG